MKNTLENNRSMEELDDSINWLEQPFEWWVQNDEPILLAIPINNKSAINLMAGLYDAYTSIHDRDLKYAVKSLQALASTLIAKSTGRIDILLDEVAKDMASGDIDEEFQKMLGEMND